MADLNAAQAQLDEKEAELAEVQAEFDKAMAEKQVTRMFTKQLKMECCYCTTAHSKPQALIAMALCAARTTAVCVTV
jgi:hypothetical protein